MHSVAGMNRVFLAVDMNELEFEASEFEKSLS